MVCICQQLRSSLDTPNISLIQRRSSYKDMIQISRTISINLRGQSKNFFDKFLKDYKNADIRYHCWQQCLCTSFKIVSIQVSGAKLTFWQHTNWCRETRPDNQVRNSQMSSKFKCQKLIYEQLASCLFCCRDILDLKIAISSKANELIYSRIKRQDSVSAIFQLTQCIVSTLQGKNNSLNLIPIILYFNQIQYQNQSNFLSEIVQFALKQIVGSIAQIN
ncbi:unnamed protein product [Paramecium octaurelia]|uniref:Uncharacterized protein n=1 Tax=Paramecium octaurelia TaxID=43137 RepID=A0A8S1XIB4_PAROT|nr:unnamed protein product [Paramecium octaurelia]